MSHSSGVDLVKVDQRHNGGEWRYLGTWSFDPSQSPKVSLLASLNGTVDADAVRFVSGDAIGGDIVYNHVDQTGTIQKVTDASGTLVWDRIARPFGETASMSGGIEQRLRFPGQYADETGTNYNYFRDYDPTLGRYTESDPIGLGGGINTYAYVDGSPIGRSDSKGLWSTPVHNQLINLFGKRMHWSADIIRALTRASKMADAWEFQGPWYSYMHAMSSDKLDPWTACRMMNQFIAQMMAQVDLSDGITVGWKTIKIGSRTVRTRAWSEVDALGFALHAAMDFTSPVHGNGRGTFPKWDFSQSPLHGPWSTSWENWISGNKIASTRALMQKVLNGEPVTDCSCAGQ